MKITFLGTGDAGGAPLYGCDCPACAQARVHPEFRRRPCSATVETAGARILIDAGLTDLTERFSPGELSAIALTHFHPDHIQGLFQLRWGKGEPIPVYCPPDRQGCADLYKNHGILEFRRLRKFESFKVGDLTLTPLPLIHSKPTFGYAIENAEGARFAYLTDTIGLPKRTETFLKRWRPGTLALDCTYPPYSHAPYNHNDLTDALEIARALAPASVSLTHVGHDLAAWLIEHAVEFPPGVSVAEDGQVVTVNSSATSNSGRLRSQKNVTPP